MDGTSPMVVHHRPSSTRSGAPQEKKQHEQERRCWPTLPGSGNKSRLDERRQRQRQRNRSLWEINDDKTRFDASSTTAVSSPSSQNAKTSKVHFASSSSSWAAADGLGQADTTAATSASSSSNTTAMTTMATPTDTVTDPFSSRSLRKSWKGDIGLALFSPLDITLDDNDDNNNKSNNDRCHHRPIGSGSGSGSKSTKLLTAAGSSGSGSSCPGAEPCTDTDDHDTDDEDDDEEQQHHLALPPEHGAEAVSVEEVGQYNDQYEQYAQYNDQQYDEEPVHLAPEDPEILQSSPRLLTPRMMVQIRNEGLHSTQQIMKWHRPYSLSRDGDSFYAMMEKCGRYKHTVVVCKTTRGDILGGYADTPWRFGSRSFFGSGRAFLFATNPDLSVEEKDWVRLSRRRWSSSRTSTTGSREDIDGEDDIDDRGKQDNGEGSGGNDSNDSVYIFKWTGNNTYSQVCSSETEQLAMGGGGAFGFIVQEHFSKGSTGPCSTFNNPRLTGDLDGCFEIVDLEVYGLKSCLFVA